MWSAELPSPGSTVVVLPAARNQKNTLWRTGYNKCKKL